MSRVEQTLASYLSLDAASSLKAPVLPSKPLRTTLALVGNGYKATGQAGACLHTMAVLQTYQVSGNHGYIHNLRHFLFFV